MNNDLCCERIIIIGPARAINFALEFRLSGIPSVRFARTRPNKCRNGRKAVRRPLYSPQHLIRTDDHWLLIVVLTITNLQHHMHPDEIAAPSLHLDEQNARSILLRLCDCRIGNNRIESVNAPLDKWSAEKRRVLTQSVLGLRLPRAVPVQQLVPRDALQLALGVADVKLAAAGAKRGRFDWQKLKRFGRTGGGGGVGDGAR